MSYKKVIYDNYVKNHNSFLYGENTLSNIRKHFPAWKYYFKKLLPATTSNILDLGCGDGNFVYFLNELGYVNVTGIDISNEQISAGKKMGINNLHCTDLLTYLDQKKATFDLIIARDVIEHFTKDEVFEICQKVNLSLKPGGQFLIQVPNGQGLFYTSIFYGDYTHEVAYTISSLNQVFKNTGYSKVECYEVAPPPVSGISIIRMLFWKVIKLVVRFLKMIITGNSKGIFTPNIIGVAQK